MIDPDERNFIYYLVYLTLTSAIIKVEVSKVYTGFGFMLPFAVIETMDRYHILYLTRRRFIIHETPKRSATSPSTSTTTESSIPTTITVNVGTKWKLEHLDVELLCRAIMTVVT